MCSRPRLSLAGTEFFYPLFLTAKVEGDANRVKLDDLL